MMLLILLPVLLFSVVVHEYAHGWMALRQGDSTALAAGRLTLNPIAHLDLFGSILFPLVLWASNAGFLFGWAKPVPVNPANYRNYVRGDVLVSIAGIAANLILAAISVLVFVLAVHAGRIVPGAAGIMDVVQQAAGYGILINLVLAVFNLIPIPPLDGSHVVYHLLPPRLGARYREVGRFGMLVLLALLIFAPGVFRYLLWPVDVLQGLVLSLIRAWT